MNHVKASTCPLPYSGDAWFDSLEEAVRIRVHAFIEVIVEAELQAALDGRSRCERRGAPKAIARTSGAYVFAGSKAASMTWKSWIIIEEPSASEGRVNR